MNLKSRVKYLSLALFMPIMYYIVNLIFYVVIALNVDIHDNDIMMYEAIFCGVFLFVCVPNYLKITMDMSNDKNFLNQRKINSKNLVNLVIITFGLIGTIDILFRLIGNIPILVESSQNLDEFFNSGAEIPYIWTFLNVVFLGPIVEEIIFRGITFNYIERASNHKVAIVLSAIIFGLWHMNIVQIVYVPIMGVILAFVYYYSGKNLLFPIVIHILNNFFAQLPESWNTAYVNYSITKTGYLLLIPMLFILYKMYRKHKSIEKINIENENELFQI